VKAKDRHKLKENDFAQTVERARELVAGRQREVTLLATLVVVALVAIGAYFAWQTNRSGKATTLLAQALVLAEAPVVTPPPPAPGSPPPVQQPGTFRTEKERAEAALPKLMEAADAYPTSKAGITARYRAAGMLAELGRYGEAEQRYREVIDKAGRTSLYGRTARLGLGEVLAAEGKTDDAIAAFRELSTETDSQLPVDGVLMQLGRAAMQGGKTDDATRAFTRVVDEFPQSLYVSEAKEKLQQLKKA
jgi:TolA-binding protein